MCYHVIWNLVQLFGDNNTLVRVAHSCVIITKKLHSIPYDMVTHSNSVINPSINQYAVPFYTGYHGAFDKALSVQNGSSFMIIVNIVTVSRNYKRHEERVVPKYRLKILKEYLQTNVFKKIWRGLNTTFLLCPILCHVLS